MARITLRQLLDHAAEYGYGFFLRAIRMTSRLRAEALVEQASAIRAAVWSEQKEFESFCHRVTAER